jgi:hypothetical protein
MLKLYFLLIMCHNYEMFRSIFTIFRHLVNINKAYTNTYMDYICFIDVR